MKPRTRRRWKAYSALVGIGAIAFFVFRAPLVKAATFAAVERDAPTLLSLCLALGADINGDLRGDGSGETWLMMAARQGKVAATRRLLERGAPIDFQREEGDTALHEAVLAEQSATTTLLVARGADVNAKNALGATPLMFAALGGNPEMVRLLLDRGARADARDNMQMPVRAYARKSKNGAVIALIADRTGLSIAEIQRHKGSRGRASAH